MTSIAERDTALNIEAGGIEKWLAVLDLKNLVSLPPGHSVINSSATSKQGRPSRGSNFPFLLREQLATLISRVQAP